MSSNIDTATNETPNQSPELKRVTIMTTGTRGDIQPFVAIGIALKREGYSVRILTHPSPTHKKLCEDFGLVHVPFGGDAEAFMKNDPDVRVAMETGDTIKFFGCLNKVIQQDTRIKCMPFVDDVIRGGEKRPDLFIVSFLNRYFGLYAKHVLKIPTIEIRLQQWVFDDPSRAPMGMPTLPNGLHRLIQTQLMIPQDFKGFRTFDNCIADILASTKTEHATKSTDAMLPRLDDFLLYDQWYDSEVNHSPILPVLITQPTIFKDVLCPTLPTSTAWRHKYVGPAVIKSADQVEGNVLPSSFGGEASKKKLEDFLAASQKKPIYMGWGSMIRSSAHEMALYAVQVLQQSNQRGIVLGGLAGLSTELLEEAIQKNATVTKDEKESILEYAKENVLFIDQAPHEWLFPQVALTVHHGGAGTLNASLRAGVPTIVTPVFGDQYDNSFVAQKLGVGFGFADKLQKIDTHTLSEKIDSVLKDPAIVEKAKTVGSQLRMEDNDGCRTIVKEVETYWNETVVSGDFLAGVRDWKIATQERKARNEKTTRRNRVALALASAFTIIAALAFLFAKTLYMNYTYYN